MIFVCLIITESLSGTEWKAIKTNMFVSLQLQSDQDHGNGVVRYVLSGEGAGSIFVIDQNNGDLHATRRLDREEKSFYILRATVVDKRTGQKLEPETEFTIKLHDINDNEPTFSKEVYTATVPERSDIGKTLSSPSHDVYPNTDTFIFRGIMWMCVLNLRDVHHPSDRHGC